MQLENVELAVPKEMNDVRKFLVQLLGDIMAKKDISLIIGGSLPALMAAVEGYEKLSEEAKMKESYNLYGLLLADIVQVFAHKPEEIAAPVA